MAKTGNRIIAINEATGERREFISVYAFSKEMGVTTRSAQQARERNGACCGWRVYDNPERIRERIKELEAQIKMLEG